MFGRKNQLRWIERVGLATAGALLGTAALSGCSSSAAPAPVSPDKASCSMASPDWTGTVGTDAGITWWADRVAHDYRLTQDAAVVRQAVRDGLVGHITCDGMISITHFDAHSPVEVNGLPPGWGDCVLKSIWTQQTTIGGDPLEGYNEGVALCANTDDLLASASASSY